MYAGTGRRRSSRGAGCCQGRIRDPLIGRDVLFGVVLGLSWLLIYEIRLDFGIGRLGLAPVISVLDYLLGLRRTIGAWIVLVPGGIQGTLFFFIILVVLPLSIAEASGPQA